MKKISILGSTGSIGTQALEVIEGSDELSVGALLAKSNTKLLEEQTRKFKPQLICIADEDKYSDLKVRLKDTNVKIVCGKQGIIETASLENVDTVLNAIVGIAGLIPTISALKAGKRLALANKESLVTAGELVMELSKNKKCEIIPVDSEHSAIFQCLNGYQKDSIKKIYLTASGGPFYGYNKKELKNVKKEDALKHPNWNMGQKITIDSATYMNKGLEVIEAMWLFGIDVKNIVPVVHRQSIVHSMVEFKDNSILAQMGMPDMRIPIGYALFYPHRKSFKSNPLDIFNMKDLTFDKVDFETFNCLNLAYEAAFLGGLYPAVLNGANEAAVELFLNDKIGFLDIYDVVKSAMDAYNKKDKVTLENVFEADKFAREYVFMKGSK